MTHRPNRPRSISRRTLLGAAAAAAVAPVGRAGAQTPAAADAIDFSARIGALLAAMPERALSEQGTFFYADLAGQLAAAGIERPDARRTTRDMPEGYVQATMALPLASRAFDSGLDPAWYPAFGFAPAALGQALMLGDGAGALAIFRGGFDPQAVRDALAASGYVAVRREHGDAFTFGDDPQLDTTVGRLTLGTMNHAVVRDDLLVFAGDEGQVEDALAVLAGEAPSMADAGRWTELAALFSSDVVGMIPVPASALAYWSGGATPAATAAALLDMAFGVRAGSRSEPLALGGEGTPLATPAGLPPRPARVEARLRYADAAIAAREAEAIAQRWRGGESMVTEEPFTALMELVDAGVSAVDPRAVALDFTSDAPNRWSQLIFTNDLSPFIPAMG
jgi:hypothetical protein